MRPVAGRATLLLLVLAVLFMAPSTAWGAGGNGRIDHVQSEDSKVELLFSVSALPTGAVPDLDSVRVTLDGAPVKAVASTTEHGSGSIQRTTILAIDVSRSMAGEAFEQAKHAAHTFIDQAPQDVRVGIVAFASGVTLVDRPTTDHETLGASVDALELSLETSLYDGVAEAVTAAGSVGQRNILVLSDGRDTTETSLSAAVEAVRSSRTHVDIVALGNDGSRTALEEIAAAGRGSVIDATDPDALNEVFAAQAAAIASQVLIRFPVPADKSGSDSSVAVSVEAAGITYSDSAFVGLSEIAPRLPVAHVDAADSSPAVGLPYLIAGLTVLVIGFVLLLLAAFGMFSPNEAGRIERRLAAYGPNSAVTLSIANEKGERGVKRAAIGAAERALGSSSLTINLARKLDAAGIPLTSAEWVLLHIGAALSAALVGAVLSGGGLAFTVLLFVVGAVLPWMYVMFKRGRRLKRFQSQLAPTLQVMSGSLSAGLSLAQSVETVVREGAEPIAGELRRALVEQRLGVEVEDALDGVATRMESKDFAWMVMAVRIQREVGGNLAELLSTVSSTLREREYLRRQVSTLSAEGRLSAWIIGGLPPVFVIYLTLVRPEYLNPMLRSSLGVMMMGLATVMMVVGALWLRQTVKIEV